MILCMEKKPQVSDSRAADKYIVRFPEGMRDRIAEAAKNNNRSMNAEIVLRLEESLKTKASSDAATVQMFEDYKQQTIKVEAALQRKIGVLIRALIGSYTVLTVALDLFKAKPDAFKDELSVKAIDAIKSTEQVVAGLFGTVITSDDIEAPTAFSKAVADEQKHLAEVLKRLRAGGFPIDDK